MKSPLLQTRRRPPNTLMMTWAIMLASLVTYLFVCYMILHQPSFHARYGIESLHTPLFGPINVLMLVYVVAVLIFTVGIVSFRVFYGKLAKRFAQQSFESTEQKREAFKKKYSALMFSYLAIFNAIIVWGVVVFLLSGDFSTLINLATLTAVGFFVVMPTQAKFNI